jgi:hypothetical protein
MLMIQPYICHKPLPITMKFFYLFALTCLLAIACKRNEIITPNKTINYVQFLYSNGTQFSSSAYIDEAGKRIIIHPDKLPGIDPDNYKVYFNTNNLSQTEPASGTVLNLSKPVAVKVIAKNGTTEVYQIIRSFTDIAIEGFDINGSKNINNLPLSDERFFTHRGNDTKLQLGKVVLAMNGSYANNYLEIDFNNTAPATMLGTYTNLAALKPFVNWQYVTTFFMKPLCDEGGVNITSYDSLTKTYSGNIVNLTSNLQSTNGVVTRYTKIYGRFENIPVQ